MDRGFRDGFMGGGRGGGAGWEGGLGSGFGWWFGICLTLITIALITLTVFAILNWITARSGGDEGSADDGGDAADAKAVLDERLARGEIGPDDYTRRITAIRGGNTDG